jgi:hypothetical protein
MMDMVTAFAEDELSLAAPLRARRCFFVSLSEMVGSELKVDAMVTGAVEGADEEGFDRAGAMTGTEG